MSEVPVQDFFEIASHKVTPARHNLCVQSYSKCVQIRSNVFLQNVKVKNFTMCLYNTIKIYGRVKCYQNVEVKNGWLRDTQIVKLHPELFSANLAGGELPKYV